MTRFHKPRSAFTLFELLTIVAVIAVLAAIAVPNFLEAQIRSKTARVRSDMAMVTVALESYRLDHGMYPLLTQPLHPVEIRQINTRLEQMSRWGVPTLWNDVSGQPPPTPTPVNSNPFMFDEMMMFGEPFDMGLTTQVSGPIARVPLKADEAATSAALAQLGYIHSPLGGNGLYALTTPIAYITAASMYDPYADRYVGQWNWRSQPELPIAPVFGYVNFQQIEPLGVSIEELGAQLPYVLFSPGPAKYMTFFPFPPVEPATVYDPTNGTVSSGYHYNWRE